MGSSLRPLKEQKSPPSVQKSRFGVQLLCWGPHLQVKFSEARCKFLVFLVQKPGSSRCKNSRFWVQKFKVLVQKFKLPVQNSRLRCKNWLGCKNRCNFHLFLHLCLSVFAPHVQKQVQKTGENFTCFLHLDGVPNEEPTGVWAPRSQGVTQWGFPKTEMGDHLRNEWGMQWGVPWTSSTSVASLLGNGRNTVSRVLFRERELTEFCGKLGEFRVKFGEFALAHK